MKIIYRYILLVLLCINVAFAQNTLTLQNKINGLTDEVLQNAEKRLQITEDLYGEPLSIDKIHKFYQQAPAEIEKAIQPFGYFKAKISSQLMQQGNTWMAVYTVIPGQRMRITKLTINIQGQGAQNQILNEAITKLPLKLNDGFSADNYSKAQSQLLNTAHQQGYLMATLVENDLQINLINYTCTIVLTINTGPRYYFGPVAFSKNPISTELLNRYLPFAGQSPYSSEKLLTLQQTLSGTGYYKSVVVMPQLNSVQNNQVPINVKLTPQAHRTYQFGIGYGSGSGARASAGTTWNWVNQYGDKLNTLLSWSQTESTLTGQYIIPGKNPATDQYSITTSVDKLNLDNDDTSLAEQIGFGKIQQFGLWQRTIGLNVQHEKDTESGINTISNLVMPNISFLRINKDDAINVMNGSRWLFTLRGADTSLLSTVNFLQGEAQYTQIFSLAENNRFILRADVGYTIVNAADLPLTVSFYAGGAPFMRGYQQNELGPGRYLLTGSMEYQRRVYGNWWATVFADDGNAMNHFNEPLQRGFGGGVVWRSPIGPIEVTVAQANSLKDKPWRIDFSLGPEI